MEYMTKLTGVTHGPFLLCTLLLLPGGCCGVLLCPPSCPDPTPFLPSPTTSHVLEQWQASIGTWPLHSLRILTKNSDQRWEGQS